MLTLVLLAFNQRVRTLIRKGSFLNGCLNECATPRVGGLSLSHNAKQSVEHVIESFFNCQLIDARMSEQRPCDHAVIVVACFCNLREDARKLARWYQCRPLGSPHISAP